MPILLSFYIGAWSDREDGKPRNAIVNKVYLQVWEKTLPGAVHGGQAAGGCGEFSRRILPRGHVPVDVAGYLHACSEHLRGDADLHHDDLQFHC